ncbi:MAG: extracellular solute-binding protein [Clostridia bacterium]|nr:extracellular solute-binding protein [Clostridia bacterium]
MKFRKVISMLLATASVATLTASFAGCSLGNRAPAVIDKEAVMSIENPETYVYPEQITIRIPVYDRGQTGQAPVTDNYWTDYVQKEFGDKHNINVEFVSIPRAGEVTKFNQLMAGKVSRQPDIIFHYDYPQCITYAKEGAFQTIDTDMLKKFAPDYYAATEDLDQYTYVNGEKVFLAGRRPRAYNFVSVIRRDWVEANGYTVPDNSADWVITQDEYYEILKSFNEKKNGGPNTIPMAFSLPNANFSNHAYRNYPISAHDWALFSDLSVCSLSWEPTYEQIKYNNNLCNMGLVSNEWYLDKDGKKSKEKFSSGVQGTYGFYLTKESAEITTLMQNQPNAKLSLTPSTTTENENGETNVLKGGRADNPFGLMTGINVHCQHPEAIMMYYEWLQDNILTMQNGIEGITYNMVDVGNGKQIPVLVDGYEGVERLNYNANKDMWCLVIEGRDYGDDELNRAAQVYTYAPKGYEYLIEQNYERISENDHLNYIDFLFDRSIDSLSDKGSTLLNDWQKYATDMFNCKPEELDAKYQSYVKAYLKAGYQQILDEKEAAYQDMKANNKLPDPLPEGIISDEEAAMLYGGDGNQPNITLTAEEKAAAEQ